jgi:hypothetical protein
MVTSYDQSSLLDALLLGEPVVTRILAQVESDGTSIPVELITLARLDETKDNSADLPQLSVDLRKRCIQAPTAAESVLFGSLSVLRLTTLGHEDEQWSQLIPRWLVPNLDGRLRAIGLLALALNSRDRLSADGYADLLDQAISLLPPESPLRTAHIYQYALYLGLRGMLQRLAGVIALPSPGDQEPEVGPELLAECFYDAVCCGRVAQAAFLENKLRSTPESAWQMGLIHMHRAFIPAFSAIMAKGELPESADLPSAPLLQALLTEDHDLLTGADMDDGTQEISPLLSYDFLRCALACRNQVQARKILDQRRQGAGSHWLDDLFLARLLLLEDKPSEAGTAFARVRASAHRYGAIERIEIELRLACELSLTDCCNLGFLGGQTASAPVSPKGAPRDTDREIAALLAGSSEAASRLREDLHAASSHGQHSVLILGPNDGSRSVIAEELLRRMNRPGHPLLLLASSVNMTDWCVRLDNAVADGRAVFIDSIENLPSEGQSHLAWRLSHNPESAIICGADGSAPRLAAQGRLNPDLYWALAGNRIDVPALCDRRTDVVEMLTLLLAASGIYVQPSHEFAITIGQLRLPGGWRQLRTLAAMITRSEKSPGFDLRDPMRLVERLNRGYEAAPA